MVHGWRLLEQYRPFACACIACICCCALANVLANFSNMAMLRYMSLTHFLHLEGSLEALQPYQIKPA
jgi:hypothetical protein